MSGDARIQACAVRAVRAVQMPRIGAVVMVDLDMTMGQRLMAVAELLGNGMSEQEAREGVQALFPAWFAQEAV